MIREMWRDGWIGRSIVLLFLSLPLLVVLVVWAAIEEGKRCDAMGGHMISKTSLGVGPAIGGNGGVAIVPQTISFCVSQDGRILF